MSCTKSMRLLKKIKIFLILLIILKAVIWIIGAFGFFTHPHIIRQSDTLGVAYKYFLTWFKSPYLDCEWYRFFLPAVLTSGDNFGISPMEFPILNLLFSLFGFFGSYYSFVISNIFFILLALALTFICYKIWSRISSSFEIPILLIPLYSISSDFIFRFMPDYISFILLLISFGMVWRNKNLRLLPIVLASIALLIKPTNVILWLIVLIRNYCETLRRLWYFIPPLFITFLYYMFGIEYLKSVSDMPYVYFHVEPRNFLKTIQEYFSQPYEILYLFSNSVFTQYSVILLLIIFLKLKRRLIKLELRLFIVLIFQLFAMAILNGAHTFVHTYYLIGSSFTICLMVNYAVIRSPYKVFLYIFMIFLYFHNLETSYYRLKPLIRGNNILQDCKVLIKFEPRLNNEIKIRTHYSDSASLGVCMGKIQNSKTARFGVYRKNEVLPKDCKVIKETNNLRLCEFSNSSSL